MQSAFQQMQWVVLVFPCHLKSNALHLRCPYASTIFALHLCCILYVACILPVVATPRHEFPLKIGFHCVPPPLIVHEPFTWLCPSQSFTCKSMISKISPLKTHNVKTFDKAHAHMLCIVLQSKIHKDLDVDLCCFI